MQVENSRRSIIPMKALRVLIPLLLLVAVFVFFGVLPRIRNTQELKAAVSEEKNRDPIVNAVSAKALVGHDWINVAGPDSTVSANSPVRPDAGFSASLVCRYWWESDAGTTVGYNRCART